MMNCHVTQKGDCARFQISGGIDEHGAEDLKSKFNELSMDSIKEVIFDFSRVDHIGSAGIGKLLLFYKNLAINGGKLRIINPSDTINELFNVLKLNAIFAISRS